MSKQIDFSGVFGSGSNGASAQEPADPVATPADPEELAADPGAIDDGASAQEPADPVTEPIDPEGAGAAAEPGAAQSPEENAKYAAARRRAEKEAQIKIDQAIREERQRADAAIAALNWTNPFDGNKPITTVEEMAAYKQAFERDQAESALSEAGLDAQTLDKIIANHPDVVSVKKEREAMQAEKERLRREEAALKLEADLKEIGKLDPTIKSADDLLALENYPEIYKRVTQNGLSILEAYKLCNLDKLQSKESKAAAQAALNHANSKSHLVGTGSRGSGGIEVPADVMAEYRKLNPHASEEAIKKHYEKRLKSRGN